MKFAVWLIVGANWKASDAVYIVVIRWRSLELMVMNKKLSRLAQRKHNNKEESAKQHTYTTEYIE